MSLTKLSLVGNNLIIPGQGEFGYSDIPAGVGKIFYSVGGRWSQRAKTYVVRSPCVFFMMDGGEGFYRVIKREQLLVTLQNND
jgi:hypothetical protein